MKSNDEILMSKVMKTINDHLADPTLNVEMLAANVGMSRVHMHRKLKELTNQSARDFIRSIRLKQAANLLREESKRFGSCIRYRLLQPLIFPIHSETFTEFHRVNIKNNRCNKQN